MSHGPPANAQQSANEIFAAAAEEKVERQRVSAETAKKEVPIKRERVVWVCLAIALPIFLTVVAINVIGVSPSSLFETPPSPTVARAEAQRTLDGLVADIESYRKDYKELPKSLTELGPRPKGTWTYTVAGSTYRVRGTLYGQRVSFDGVASGPRH